MKTFIPTFEEYLGNIHAEKFPTILDDDMPDHFDDWLSRLDVSELMVYGQRYGIEINRLNNLNK
jgi:hypothetical protein